MKNRPEDETRATINRAIRDIAFLYHLFFQINTRAMMEQQSWSLQLAALAGTLGCLAIESTYYGVHNNWAIWKDIGEKSLLELYSFQGAVTSISERYFDGHQVLFADLAKDLTAVITGAEGVVNTFNEILPQDNVRHIDLNALCRDASKKASGQVAFLVDMAKVEALIFMGDSDIATKVVEGYLS